MTIRELIIKALDSETNIYRSARIRIVRRNDDGVVVSYRIVDISRYFGDGLFVVEGADLDAAEEEIP